MIFVRRQKSDLELYKNTGRQFNDLYDPNPKASKSNVFHQSVRDQEARVNSRII